METTKEQGNDRLSALPNEILVNILSFLPIQDAVRTVALRRFENLWTMLPTLVLDTFCSRSIIQFIRNVLKYHKNPTINRLEFCRARISFEHDQDVVNLIEFALRKNTKVLRILGNLEPTALTLPPTVFMHHCLASLHITGFKVELKSGAYMPSLRVLSLSFVTMSDETFKVMISACPCLQELVVKCPCEFRKLHFTAPSIEKFMLDLSMEVISEKNICYSLNCPNLKILNIEDVFIDKLQILDVSSVREAKINICGVPNENTNVDHCEILVDKFQHSEFFQLGRYPKSAHLQLEQCGNVRLSSGGRNYWTHITLRSGIRGSCSLGICRLLRNSRLLEELIIYANVDFCCDCNMLLHELSSPCVMRQLKLVTIRDYEKPSNALLQLIEFLLTSAVVLDRLVIAFHSKDRIFSMEGDEFIMKLLSFARASQNAHVIFS